MLRFEPAADRRLDRGSHMKIADVRAITLSYPCNLPYASAFSLMARRCAVLVEIETDDGIVGIGEAGTGGGATS
jgi:L-alanine-DL-glutamate epimerase-like enolase superfamily enzyme